MSVNPHIGLEVLWWSLVGCEWPSAVSRLWGNRRCPHMSSFFCRAVSQSQPSRRAGASGPKSRRP